MQHNSITLALLGTAASILLGTEFATAQECAPDPTSGGCVTFPCTDPSDACIATAYGCDAAGGCAAATCDCVGSVECHAEVIAPGVIDCVGGCTGGGTCTLLASDTNGDGTDDLFECLCQAEDREACCTPTLTCSLEFPANCLALGGSPQGSGSECGGDGNSNGLDDLCEANCSAELCNGVDDNCNQLIDEGFSIFGIDQNTGEAVEELPLGSICVAGEGVCESTGVVVCSQDGTGAECNAVPLPPGIEGPVDDPSCSNFLDDDCDGLVDHLDPDCQGPEQCDGFDNNDNGLVDEDFPELGNTCSAGVGVCLKQGTVVCTPDGLGTTCTASPYPPGVEGPPDSIRCSDNLDNDCDGLVDLQDPDCQQDEKCDGKDNDGDGDADEDFPGLGDQCIVGEGLCTSIGQVICTPNQNGTMCSASPGKGFPEGPAGCACADGIDNDCDGLIDIDDPDCGSSQIRAFATMSPTCGPIDNGCESWFAVDFESINGGGQTTLTAELQALDANDNVLATIPVENGDLVRLASRGNELDFTASTFETVVDLNALGAWEDCATGPNAGPIAAGCEYLNTDCDDDVDAADFLNLQMIYLQNLRYHEVSAPVPLLHIIADDGHNKSHAFASNAPYVGVLEPDDTVVSISEGDVTRVLAAIPRIDPATLAIKVDGVDLLAGLGIDPATDFPGGPFGGEVNIGTCTVKVCELVVESAPVNQSSGNSVSMYLENLCCGGHIVVIEGDKRPGSYPDQPETGCHVDELKDKGISHGFEITVFSPNEGDVTPGPPTLVVGEVCHGRDICAISKTCPPQLCGLPDCLPHVKVNGLEFPVNDRIIELGDGENSADTYRFPFSTVRPQTDLVQDVGGVGIPGTLDPGANRLIAEAWDNAFNTTFDNLFFAVGPILNAPGGGNPFAGDGTQVEKAINLVLNSQGLHDAIAAILNQEIPGLFEQEVKQWIADMDGQSFNADIHPVCQPKITIHPDPDSLTIDLEAFNYFVMPINGEVFVSAQIPPVTVNVSAGGHCKIIACSLIFPDLCTCALSVAADITVKLEIINAAIEFTVTEADILNNNDITPTLVLDPNNINVADVVDSDIDIGCWLGFVLDLLNILEPVENVLEIIVEFYIEEGGLLDLGSWIDITDPDQAIPMSLFELNNIDLAELAIGLEFDKNVVAITPQGLTVSYTTEFIPLEIDPEAGDIPGTPLTDAPLPLPPVGDEITAAISDDAINQMFHALTQTGILMTGFEDVRTLGEMLPADCNVLPSAEERGQCKGAGGQDCLGLPANEIPSCLLIESLLENLNINPLTQTLLHGRVDVAPKILLADDVGTPGVVEGVLRISQMSIGIVADRDNNGSTAGDINTLPSCFAANPSTQDDCSFWEACLDFNIFVNLTVNVAGTEITVTSSEKCLSTGTQCAGGTQDVVDAMIQDVAVGLTLDLIEQSINNDVPPIALEGMDFGGILELQNATLITIELDGYSEFQDYIGITASLNP